MLVVLDVALGVHALAGPVLAPLLLQATSEAPVAWELPPATSAAGIRARQKQRYASPTPAAAGTSDLSDHPI